MKAEADAVSAEQVNESYLLHVYRRSKSDKAKLVGTIELIGSEQQQAFKTADQLLKILGADHPGTDTG
jgi:hypothetical protein